MSMRCVRCAIDHPDDKRFCMACSDPLASTDDTSPPFPRCSNCGDAVSATHHFCPGCGTRHGDEPLTVPAASTPSTREFVGVVSGLVLALLLALGVNAYRSRGGSGAVAPVPSAGSQLAIGQVATADDIGIQIVGVGAADPGRSQAVIRDAVEQHFAELQQSYLAALEADSSAEGIVTLHMTLAADGTVAYVRSTFLGLADRGFVTIVERQAAAWRFGPSQAGFVSVHYPLVFHLPKTNPHELVTRLRKSSVPVVGASRSTAGA